MTFKKGYQDTGAVHPRDVNPTLSSQRDKRQRTAREANTMHMNSEVYHYAARAENANSPLNIGGSGQEASNPRGEITHQPMTPELKDLTDFNKQIIQDYETQPLDPNGKDFNRVRNRNNDARKFNKLLNAFKESGGHTDLQPRELTKYDKGPGGADDSQSEETKRFEALMKERELLIQAFQDLAQEKRNIDALGSTITQSSAEYVNTQDFYQIDTYHQESHPDAHIQEAHDITLAVQEAAMKVHQDNIGTYTASRCAYIDKYYAFDNNMRSYNRDNGQEENSNTLSADPQYNLALLRWG